MNIFDRSSARRRLILHADDFGMCRSTNEAILDLWRRGAITSTTLMVNCPWSLQAAKAAVLDPSLDVGVHLTSTSEWDAYKWRPVLQGQPVNTLVDAFGYFPPDTGHMPGVDRGQLRAELIAQIELARRMGVDPTHLDNHMGSLRGGRDELLVELAAEFGLPIRFTARPAYPSGREAEIAALAREKGVLHPDYVIGLPFSYGADEDYESVRENVLTLLRGLEPGLTEMLFHPSLDTDELKGITDTWRFRRFDYELFLDPLVQSVIQEESIVLTGWRELRDLQRGQARA
ncbi:polysaccharide deacetylase family protein [Saccharibacillus sp. CPCC 101409]|uniref:polysaccharide deacetylase family protein n=1 Tax=Saccharibacillus sp. CPCC 101409 TaxID=3058041 RepID=UPI0026714945|nr:polysaccharide deacetylase family protein [Saccharibacillus sp. CPCC 101409]MDO3409282.1 polysaccharide deacetylase family protein [Saccharibacillus sp. CPCC 101409]